MNVNVYPAQPNPTETSTIHVYIVFAHRISRIKVEGLGGDHRRARFLHHALLGVLEQMVLM